MELFWDVCHGDKPLYEELVTAVVSGINFFRSQQNQIQLMLLKNVLKENEWSAMFATDVCCVYARYVCINVFLLVFY